MAVRFQRSEKEYIPCKIFGLLVISFGLFLIRVIVYSLFCSIIISSMVDSKARMESMLFEYGTTYLSDYQLPPLSEHYLTTYKVKKKNTEKKPLRPLKDTHTMSDLKAAIPFDLLIKRKDIIGTHPRTLQKKVDDLDLRTGLDEVIRTRPRLIMTPAVAMDDIPEKHVRDILIADTYTSCTARALRQAVKPYVSVRAPLPEHPAPAKPVPLEWRMETITWDDKQLRSYSDPDKEFWIEHQSKMKECSVCKETSFVKNHRDLQRQRKMNAARR